MKYDLTKGKLVSTLLKFALPILAANILQAVYGAVDLLVVGQFSTAANQSAVSIGSQVMSLVTLTVIGLAVGATVLIGQYVGASDDKSAAKTVGATVALFAAIAVGLTAIMAGCSSVITAAMNTPQEAVQYTNEYLFTCSCGIIFIVAFNVLSAVFNGMGDSRTPLICVVIACIVNIGLDIGLVWGANMGALGAAIATIAAQALSVIFALGYLIIKKFPFEFSKKYIRFEAKTVKSIIKLGFPVAVQNMLISLSFLIITAIINPMGVVASASVGVVEKLITFMMMPAAAFGTAMSAFAAQNMAAGQEQRAVKALRISMLFSLAIGVVVCVYCQFLPETLTKIFSGDTDIIYNSGLYLKSYCIDCIMVAIIFNLNGLFNGTGKTMFTLLHSVLVTFLVRVPLAYFLSKLPNVTLWEIGFAPPASSLFSVALCIFYYLKGYWKRNLNFGTSAQKIDSADVK